MRMRAFFGGVPRRGIYDYLKPAVAPIRGKLRTEEIAISPKSAVHPGQYWTPEAGQLCKPFDMTGGILYQRRRYHRYASVR